MRDTKTLASVLRGSKSARARSQAAKALARIKNKKIPKDVIAKQLSEASKVGWESFKTFEERRNEVIRRRALGRLRKLQAALAEAEGKRATDKLETLKSARELYKDDEE